MSDLRRIGRDTEDVAARSLTDQGWTIVTRRYKARHGEIDLIAMDGNILVFIEIKFRQSRDASAEEAIGGRKLESLARAIAQYLSEVSWGDRPFRVDVIAMDSAGVRHHRDVLSSR